jgi:hypothetical protein
LIQRSPRVDPALAMLLREGDELLAR